MPETLKPTGKCHWCELPIVAPGKRRTALWCSYTCKWLAEDAAGRAAETVVGPVFGEREAGR